MIEHEQEEGSTHKILIQVKRDGHVNRGGLGRWKRWLDDGRGFLRGHGGEQSIL
jgi:hypothetical protein